MIFGKFWLWLKAYAKIMVVVKIIKLLIGLFNSKFSGKIEIIIRFVSSWKYLDRLRMRKKDFV